MEAFYKVAETVIRSFDAFKGSRPSINTENILIVRSRSRTVIPLDQFDEKLTQIGQELEATEITTKKKIGEILTRGEQFINQKSDGYNVVDGSGLERMKLELESMGLVVAYKVFSLPKCDFVVAIWEDKNEIPPLYIEVTVTSKEDVKLEEF